MKSKQPGLEQYASKSALVFAGSLMVLSVAFNNIGLGKVIDAYSQRLIADIKQECPTPQVSPLLYRVERLEADSHKPSSKAHAKRP